MSPFFLCTTFPIKSLKPPCFLHREISPEKIDFTANPKIIFLRFHFLLLPFLWKSISYDLIKYEMYFCNFLYDNAFVHWVCNFSYSEIRMQKRPLGSGLCTYCWINDALNNSLFGHLYNWLANGRWVSLFPPITAQITDGRKLKLLIF